MIYATCPSCGFIIDVFTDEEINSPVREKRLKYLLTRDQVCPNCLTTIGKCAKMEAKEEEIPIFQVQVNEKDKINICTFSKEHGYAAVTEYTLKHFRGEIK